MSLYVGIGVVSIAVIGIVIYVGLSKRKQSIQMSEIFDRYDSQNK